MWNWKVGNNYSHEIDTLLLKRHLRVSFVFSRQRIDEPFFSIYLMRSIKHIEVSQGG